MSYRGARWLYECLASLWAPGIWLTRIPEPPRGIFGVPLSESIKYANVAISLTNDNGESFIYGFVPIVVAKCGVFLKEKGACSPEIYIYIYPSCLVKLNKAQSNRAQTATDVEGIFRLSGSAKRIKDLQEIFDSPDRYGKGLDWTGYTVHDAANVLRRFLNQLPEPIVPLEFYERFREPLRDYQKQIQANGESAELAAFDHAKAVATYQQLIRELPPLHKQLLLYILDLLAVFASKSDQNRMTSANLAAIFQPGLLSHPQHDMSPEEYKLSQDVLIFLIENQDHFLFGMNGTAADEQTMKEVESGMTTRAPSHTTVRRSISNASGGAEGGSRKSINLRRNVSVSSKNSRSSNNTPAGPGTPVSLTGNGVYRSNTVPSKMSPVIPAARFRRDAGDQANAASAAAGSKPSSSTQGSSSANATSRAARPQDAVSADSGQANSGVVASAISSAVSSAVSSRPAMSTHSIAASATGGDRAPTSSEKLDQPRMEGLPTSVSPSPPVITPTKERKLSSFFARSPPSNGEAKEPRQPNRLKKQQKKWTPGHHSESAQSSSNSLHAAITEPSRFIQPDGNRSAVELTPRATYPPSPAAEDGPSVQLQQEQRSTKGHESVPSQAAEGTLQPHRSRTPSMNSRSSFTDQSDPDPVEDSSKSERKDQRRSWRFPRPSRRNNDSIGSSLAASALMEGNSSSDIKLDAAAAAATSDKSRQPRQVSPPSDRHLASSESLAHVSGLEPDASNTRGSIDSSQASEPEKKGLFSMFKAKVSQVRDAAKEPDSSERARSPGHADVENPIASLVGGRPNAQGMAGKDNSAGAPRDDVAVVVNNGAGLDSSIVAPQITAPPQASVLTAVIPEEEPVTKSSNTHQPEDTQLAAGPSEAVTSELASPKTPHKSEDSAAVAASS